jgi:hypothetical protein
LEGLSLHFNTTKPTQLQFPVLSNTEHREQKGDKLKLRHLAQESRQYEKKLIDDNKRHGTRPSGTVGGKEIHCFIETKVALPHATFTY